MAQHAMESPLPITNGFSFNTCCFHATLIQSMVHVNDRHPLLSRLPIISVDSINLCSLFSSIPRVLMSTSMPHVQSSLVKVAPTAFAVKEPQQHQQCLSENRTSPLWFLSYWRLIKISYSVSCNCVKTVEYISGLRHQHYNRATVSISRLHSHSLSLVVV